MLSGGRDLPGIGLLTMLAAQSVGLMLTITVAVPAICSLPGVAFRVRQRDQVRGVIHEYQHVA